VQLETSEIRVETSTLCNYRCVMCPRERLTRRQQTMPNDLFERILRSAKATFPELQMCTVSGFGELAADSEWRTKLRLACQLFDEVHVVTNLSLVKESELSELAEHTTEVRVSLYASDEAAYRSVHRPPQRVAFADQEAKVRRLVELGAKVQLTCCELDENRESVRAFIDRWQDVVDSVEVWRPHNWVNGREYRALAEDRLPSCGRPATGPIQVQVDGTVNVCCFDFDGAMLIGDLKQQSFSEIFEGAELARIRRLHATGRADELPLCKGCDQRDPPSRKASYLVHSRQSPEQRVCRTSSKRELLPVVQDGPEGHC
jgi:hypothetical protein